MKAVNILSALSSAPLAWGGTGFFMSHRESIKPNLKLTIWVWVENTTRRPLTPYSSAFTISVQPNFTRGFVLSHNKLNGIHLSPCGIKTLQEMTSCYLTTIPSLLLSSVIIYAAMHIRTKLFHISYVPKKTGVLGFSKEMGTLSYSIRRISQIWKHFYNTVKGWHHINGKATAVQS